MGQREFYIKNVNEVEFSRCCLLFIDLNDDIMGKLRKENCKHK